MFKFRRSIPSDQGEGKKRLSVEWNLVIQRYCQSVKSIAVKKIGVVNRV